MPLLHLCHLLMAAPAAAGASADGLTQPAAALQPAEAPHLVVEPHPNSWSRRRWDCYPHPPHTNLPTFSSDEQSLPVWMCTGMHPQPAAAPTAAPAQDCICCLPSGSANRPWPSADVFLACVAKALHNEEQPLPTSGEQRPGVLGVLLLQLNSSPGPTYILLFATSGDVTASWLDKQRRYLSNFKLFLKDVLTTSSAEWTAITSPKHLEFLEKKVMQIEKMSERCELSASTLLDALRVAFKSKGGKGMFQGVALPPLTHIKQRLDVWKPPDLADTIRTELKRSPSFQAWSTAAFPHLPPEQAADHLFTSLSVCRIEYEQVEVQIKRLSEWLMLYYQSQADALKHPLLEELEFVPKGLFTTDGSPFQSGYFRCKFRHSPNLPEASNDVGKCAGTKLVCALAAYSNARVLVFGEAVIGAWPVNVRQMDTPEQHSYCCVTTPHGLRLHVVPSCISCQVQIKILRQGLLH